MLTTWTCSLAANSAGASTRIADSEDKLHIKSSLVQQHSMLSAPQSTIDKSYAAVFVQKAPVINTIARGISGFESNSLEDAVTCIEKGSQPLSWVVKTLQKCRKERHHQCALRLYVYIRHNRLEVCSALGNELILVLVEVGCMLEAQDLFDRLTYRNESSWNFLITGLIRSGELNQALLLYHKMQEDDSSNPTPHTFIGLVKACGKLQDLESGNKLYDHIASQGLLERNVFVGTALVDMYAKCGSLAKAQEVFDKIPIRDVVLWNTLITSYAQHGCGEEALKCFDQMKCAGILPDAVTYVGSLKACGSIRSVEKGQEIHAEIGKKGTLEKDLFVGTALVDMYSKCGLLKNAREALDKLRVRNVISWTALMAGYLQHGHGKEALNCYEQMRCEGVLPNIVTFVCSLKACGCIGAIDKGQEIHAEISKKGLGSNPFVGNILIDMYSKCGCISKAREVFNKLSVRDIASWNAIITGYAQHGLGEEALNCFQQMQLEGVPPDVITFVTTLKACASISAADKGQQLHAKIIAIGLEIDHILGNTLVDMYAKCCLFAKAQKIFDRLPVRDVVSWNALITGCCQHGSAWEALDCFERMKEEGISPDAVTFICSLKACAIVGATNRGVELHTVISGSSLSEQDPVVGTALVDMYAKCGFVAKAQEVFDKLSTRNVVSWTALIAGYALLGETEKVYDVFQTMVSEGINPNMTTFNGMLNACSHTGLVYRGQIYLEAMSEDFGIVPNLEHYTCMIDLLSRAGQLDKVLVLIKNMPLHVDLAVWLNVLGACYKWSNVGIARHAFENAVQLDENHPAAYIGMANIYSDAGMQENVHSMKAMRVTKRARNLED